MVTIFGMSTDPGPSAGSQSAIEVLVAGRFEVEAILGRGGMGAVYRVRDRHNGRSLALKRLLPSRAPSAALRAQFEREYTTLAQLAHPRIIEVYDYGIDGSGAYYTMELLEGADMSELSPLPYPLACRYLREVATSLALLHARKLLHRDVTPRNVRLTTSGHCKLLDFGALAAVGEAVAAIGTTPSMPPEALESEPLDARLDLYALGCLAYFMLTGRHAYPASNARQLPSYWARTLDAPSAAMPENGRNGQPLPAIPQALDELVLSLLKLDRAERPASAGAVIDRIDLVLGQAPGDELELAESYLLSAPTVGREEPLADAARCLDQLARGRGATLLLEGAAGSGKSRLLSEIALAGRLRGAAVVHVDAALHERPYATAHALLADLLELVPQASRDAAAAHASVLGHIAPELSTALRQALEPQPDDPLLWRTRVHAALRGFLVALAGKVPVVLLVDNLQRCDHASAALIASLAREVRQHALLIVAGLRSEAELLATASCNAVQQLARVHALSGLSAEQTRTWFEALFMDAPNMPRLAQFLHARTGGNPGAISELSRFLIRRGDMRYRDGTWVLPPEPAALALPDHAHDALARTIAGLAEPARALARSLCLYRGAMTLELCRTLAGDCDDAALRCGLDQLTAAGVLVLGRQGYGFAHDALRQALQQELDSAQRAQLQRRIADEILNRKDPHISEQMEAGLHLLEAGDERGMALLTRSAVKLCERAADMEACTRTLERAVELCRARGRNAYEVAPLYAALGLSAYMVDRRLDRHMPQVVRCCDDLLGLRLSRRLRPWIGRHLSLYFGLASGAVRYWLAPRAMRQCSFTRFVHVFVASLTGLCGKAAICLDGPTIDRLAAVIEPLSALGSRSSAKYMYDYWRGLKLMTTDRLARTHAHWLDLERRLYEPRALRDIAPDVRRILEGGVNYVLGLLEAFAGDAKVLERAEQLEQSEIDVHALIAAQLRVQYHGYRGEADRLAQATVEMEACAIQTGYSWQVESWSALSLNLIAGLWDDLLLTKSTLEQSERVAEEEPSLVRYAKSARSVYTLLRGQPDECIRISEQVLSEEPRHARIGWSTVCGVLAEAYGQVGEHARAKALCEQVLSEAEPGDAVYFGIRLKAELALATAHAALGELEAADRQLERLLASYASNASPLALGSVHETAARVALMRKDRKAFTRHIKEVERLFCPLGNPSLVARFRRLTALGGADGGMDAKIASARELRAFDATLAALSDRREAGRHMFTWLMQRCEGFDGFLLARDASGFTLLASSGQDDVPAAALEIVERSLQTLGREEATTRFGSDFVPGTDNDAELAVHVHLLSFVDADHFHGEGALVLHGRSEKPPRIRHELLQVAARHLRRLRGAGEGRPQQTAAAQPV
jgi:hypothetical protein